MILLTALTETLRDLGVPTVLGAAAGAVIGHLAAKARGLEDHERALDMLALQDERRGAQSALEGARSMRHRVNQGDVENWGAFHNEWMDRVLEPTRIIRDDEIHERVSAFGTVIFLATITRDEHVSYAILRGALDVEEWLEAWLRREPSPAAQLPSTDEVRRLVRVGGRISFEPLNSLLAGPLP